MTPFDLKTILYLNFNFHRSLPIISMSLFHLFFHMINSRVTHLANMFHWRTFQRTFMFATHRSWRRNFSFVSLSIVSASSRWRLRSGELFSSSDPGLKASILKKSNYRGSTLDWDRNTVISLMDKFSR